MAAPSVGVSSSSQSNPLAQLGDVDSGAPVFVIGGGKSNWVLIAGLAAVGLLVFLLFFRRRS